MIGETYTLVQSPLVKSGVEDMLVYCLFKSGMHIKKDLALKRDTLL